MLVDLGRRAGAFARFEKTGVSLDRECKASEIKVARITFEGGPPIEIRHRKPGDRERRVHALTAS